MLQWLHDNTQQWTPFSMLLLIATIVLSFIVIWDVIHNLPIPAFIVGLLSFLLGGTGATTLVTHGSNLANGTIENTAKAVATTSDTTTAAAAATTAAAKLQQEEKPA